MVPRPSFSLIVVFNVVVYLFTTDARNNRSSHH